MAEGSAFDAKGSWLRVGRARAGPRQVLKTLPSFIGHNAY